MPLPLFALQPPENSRQTTPPTTQAMPGAAERCNAFGSAGRPDRAATTEMRAAVRAGRLAARMDVRIASSIPMAIAHQGSFNGSTRCAVSVSRDGT